MSKLTLDALTRTTKGDNMKDYYTQQAEDHAGIYKDNDGNVYDLHCYCGYWSLFLRVGNNGHTKTIIGCKDLTACLREIKRRGLTKEEK